MFSTWKPTLISGVAWNNPSPELLVPKVYGTDWFYVVSKRNLKGKVILEPGSFWSKWNNKIKNSREHRKWLSVCVGLTEQSNHFLWIPTLLWEHEAVASQTF